MPAFERVLKWGARLAGAVAAIAVLAVLLLDHWHRAYPPLPSPLELEIVFPAGNPGQGEPLLVTGYADNCDVLLVQYLDAGMARIVYDVWGMGGPASAPFPVQPGTRHRLEIEMPTLVPVRRFVSHEQRPLRVTLDGRDLLRAPVYFHRRAPAEIYAGQNLFGGSLASAEFRGEMAWRNGRAFHGGADRLFSAEERWRWLIGERCWHSLATGLGFLAIGVAVAWLVERSLRWLVSQTARAARAAHEASAACRIVRPFEGAATAPHRWFAISAVACGVAFAAVITQGTFAFKVAEPFGNFFDAQAASLLHGRLDVPESVISGEAFVVRGKFYGYFGLTPSLLRLPFVIAGIAVGELSRSFMLAYYIAALVAAYLLLCTATQLLCGAGKWPSRGSVVAFTASVGLGSSLFFLGSRAYIYHEAILCGAAFALWSSYFTLRFLAEPQRRWWIAALASAVLAMHARPPAGLFALALVGTAALVQGWTRRPGAWPRTVLIGGLATVGLLSFSGVSYLKFRTFDGSPFHYAVQYTPERRARFDNRNFHLSNVPHNVGTYVWHAAFDLKPRFPYFYFGGNADHDYPNAKIDLAEPTVALPFVMPALVAFAVVGGGWVLCFAAPLRQSLLVVVVSFAPVALALFAAIVVSHRYTGDFCAGLITIAALGLATLDADRKLPRWLVRPMIAALVVLSIGATTALSLQFQGEMVWGVPEQTRQNYQRLRDRADAWLLRP